MESNLINVSESLPVELINVLDVSEKEILLASNEKKIRDIEVSDIQIFCVDVIQKAYFDCGQTIGKEDLIIMAQQFGAELRAYFYTITLKEVQLAFYKGVRKIYGEYFGLNLVTFYSWIKNYVSSSERQNAKKKQLQYIESLNKKEPTEEEKNEKLKAYALEEFENFKTGAETPYFDAFNTIYEYLNKRKIITFTTQRKKEFMENAKNRLQNRLNLKIRDAKDSKEIVEIRKKINELSIVNNLNVVSEAKRVALQTFFKELVDMDEELKNLL